MRCWQPILLACRSIPRASSIRSWCRSCIRCRAAAAAAAPVGRASLRHADPLVGPGRRQPDGLLVSGVPERRRSARRVTVPVALRAPHLYQCLRAFCLAAFAVERGVELPFCVRGAPDARRTVALRVPAARPRLRRRAGADAAPPARHAERDRRPEARAGGGDLRARALGHRRHRRRRALPLDPAADADLDGRALRRLRLARRRLRVRVRRVRAHALRHGALVRRDRAAGRPLGGPGRRARRRTSAAPDRRRRDLVALARGTRPDAARVRP